MADEKKKSPRNFEYVRESYPGSMDAASGKAIANFLWGEKGEYEKAAGRAWDHGPLDALSAAYHEGGGGVPGILAAVDQGGRTLDAIPGIGPLLGGLAKAGVKGATLWPFLTASLRSDISSGGRKVADAINRASSSNLDELRRVPKSTWKDIVGDLDSDDFNAFQRDFDLGNVDIGFVGSRTPTRGQAEERIERGLNPNISGPLFRREVSNRGPWGTSAVHVGAPPATGKFSVEEAMAAPSISNLVKPDFEGDRFSSELVQILYPDAHSAHIMGPAPTHTGGPPACDTVIDMGGARFRPQYSGAGFGNPSGRSMGRSDPRHFLSRRTRDPGDAAWFNIARDHRGVDLGTTAHTGWQERGEDLFDLLRRDAEAGDIEADFIMALRDADTPGRMDDMRDVLSGLGLYPEAGPNLGTINDTPELIHTNMDILERLMRKWADEWPKPDKK